MRMARDALEPLRWGRRQHAYHGPSHGSQPQKKGVLPRAWPVVGALQGLACSPADLTFFRSVPHRKRCSAAPPGARISSYARTRSICVSSLNRPSTRSYPYIDRILPYRYSDDRMPTTQITLRNVDAELSRRLRTISEERGESLNSTVLALLRDAVDLETRRIRLRRYVTWTPDELDEFTVALRSQRVVDQRYWGVGTC